MRRSSSVVLAAAVVCLGVSGLAAGGASSSVQVIGKSLAASCSSAAFAGRTDPKAMGYCSTSLLEELLPRRDRAATHVNRGVMHLLRRSYDAAFEDFQAAAVLEPELGEVYANRGTVLVAQGLNDRALVDFDRALELGVRFPERTYYNRAIAREALNDARGAYLDYRRALELNPKWTKPREQLGRFTVVSR